MRHSIRREDLETLVLMIVKEFHNVFSVCNQKTPLLVPNFVLVHVLQKTISRREVAYFLHEKKSEYIIFVILCKKNLKYLKEHKFMEVKVVVVSR